MRLFIAVELPPAVLDAATAVSRSLQQRIPEFAPAARLTWIPADRMHLTIRFLGEVDAGEVRTLEAALAQPFETPAFTISLDRPGTFPARGAARVLWLGIDKGRSSVVGLEREVSERLTHLGLDEEGRAFSPHLTLARVRDPRGLRLAVPLDQLANAPAGEGLIDAITLFESRLSPKGPTYTSLARTPLRSALVPHTHS